jgi:DNA-binding CsgD family transcriptional regulator
VHSEFDDAEGLAFVLDQMPVGVLLVDGSGRVVWMNRNAQALIRSGDGITLCDGRPAATSAGKRTALDRLIERAVAASSEGATRDPETIALRRPSEAHPLVVVVRPVDRPSGSRAKYAARAVIFLSDTHHDLRASRERLQNLFKLTPAESQLVSLLAAGHSLQTAASQLAITNESARTYLKHVFEKTGTRRQAELVRLALAAATAGAGDA